MDGKLSKVSVEIQFDPVRSFVASPEDQKYRGIPKFYGKIYWKFVFDEAATEYE